MKPIIHRLPVSVSYRDDILLYGIDNLYPQRIEAVVDRSPITKSAIQVTADFLNGAGFSQNGEAMLGDYSANELLVWCSPDFSLYYGLAFILDIAMTGEIAEIYPIDFRHVRLGVPTKEGEITYCKVSVDWEDQLPRSLKPKTITYPIWPGTPEEALDIVSSWDVESYGEFNGFIYYWTPRKNTYPLSTIDSVIDSSQTNAEIQLFELAGVQNGFLGATLLKHPGKIESNEERARINQMVASIRGAENANSVVLWEVPDGYDTAVLEQFPANDQDKLFLNTNKTTVNRIVQTLAIPPSLLGIMPENSFFNMTEIEDSYKYYNVRTNNRRKQLARIFEDLGSNFVTPVVFGDIIPQSFTFEGEQQKPGNSSADPDESTSTAGQKVKPEKQNNVPDNIQS